ncbi:hypothetical protein D4Q52_16830 [Rhodopseudomonas palustris]|uniref:Uncharacterized protein n=1 Tax=Rhodopseudomonas palustris TaxID=1076 RepID=A0A418V323_RHOPL|nr:hypothetical protein D4Q52_16830 [Rhodopseudomonas palustris]
MSAGATSIIFDGANAQSVDARDKRGHDGALAGTASSAAVELDWKAKWDRQNAEYKIWRSRSHVCNPAGNVRRPPGTCDGARLSA